MELYTYFRSSTSYRVRIACELKGIDVKHIPVNLSIGEQNQPGYRSINPAGGVPALDIGGFTLTQSLAIIDYLDSLNPDPRLLPDEALMRALVLEISYLIATDIHPLTNLRILNYLKDVIGVDEDRKRAWITRWITDGLSFVEKLLLRHGYVGNYCLGNKLTLADVCIVPQVASAHRFSIDTAQFSTINRVYENCMLLKAFQAAAPKYQSDAF